MDRHSIRHICAVKFFVGLTCLMATPGMAQLSENEMFCWGLLPGQPDALVAACTAVIEAGGVVMKLSKAHCNRGVWYQDRGHVDLAIADYDESVRLAPKSLEAHLCHGLGNFARNAFDAAIIDFNEGL